MVKRKVKQNVTVRFQPFQRPAHVAHTNYRVSEGNISLKNKMLTCKNAPPNPEHCDTHHDESLIATEQNGDSFFAFEHEDSVQTLPQPSTLNLRGRYTSVRLILGPLTFSH